MLCAGRTSALLGTLALSQPGPLRTARQAQADVHPAAAALHRLHAQRQHGWHTDLVLKNLSGG